MTISQHHTAGLLFLLPCLAFAQAPTEPPVYLRFLRTLGRPDLPLVQSYATADTGVIMLGATSISGARESWLIELHDSYGAIEDLDQKLNPDTDALIQVGLYLPNLSYRPDQAVRNLTRARYFSLTLYRILPGTDSLFGDLMRARRAAFDAANLDRPEMTYRIVSGAPSGTYVIVAPLTSLRLMDNGQARNPAYAESLTEGAGAANRKLAADTVVSRENTILRVQPSLSRVPADFWAPPPQ
ncbi:MAG TPA: hypothetical protein VGK29_11415 [Paludibaculum sp.]|jgi:hypothetical protein